MKVFEDPTIVFVEFEEDIITASGCVTGGGNDLPFQP